MSIILAIESSTDIASVALAFADDGAGSTAGYTRLLQRQVDGVQSHSLAILPMAQALLAEAGIGLDRCDAIAFGAGPGSFTGVRIACGIAQGLGHGSGRPVVAVDTLAAAAQSCRDATGSDDVLVILDARMGQVYWGRYRWHADAAGAGGDWVAVSPARVDAPSAVTVGALEAGAEDVVTPCGNGLTVHAAQLAALLAQPQMRPPRAECMPHAAQVAALGQRLLRHGQAVAARQAQPIYLRNDVALTTAERAARREIGQAVNKPHGDALAAPAAPA